MKTKEKSKGGKSSGGLTVQSFGGLSKKRYSKGQGWPRITLKQGDTRTVQFAALISDEKQWKEIEQHQFQDGGKWNYVPCLGKNCPLCEDEDNDVRKTHYRFFTNAYDFKEKQWAVLEGPKDLSGRIARKFERLKKAGKEARFLKTTYDISKMATTPVSYDVDNGDDNPVKLDPKKLVDLDAYLLDQAVRYFGEDMPTSKSKGKSALDDDDDDAEDDEYDEDDLEEMSTKEIKRIAKGLKIKLVNPKTDEDRSKATLIKLILKKQG